MEKYFEFIKNSLMSKKSNYDFLNSSEEDYGIEKFCFLDKKTKKKAITIFRQFTKHNHYLKIDIVYKEKYKRFYSLFISSDIIEFDLFYQYKNKQDFSKVVKLSTQNLGLQKCLNNLLDNFKCDFDFEEVKKILLYKK